MSTSEILSHLRKKDKRAFLEAIYAFKEDSISYLYRKVACDRELGEDIFIDAVMVLWDKSLKGGLDDVKEIKGYLIGTCYMIWSNTYKKNKKMRDAVPDVERYYYEYRNVSGVDEENPALFKEKLFQISREALQSLGEKCKKIIDYFYYQHKNMEEIATLMDFNSAAVVSSLKYRCFKELKQKANDLASKTNLND